MRGRWELSCTRGARGFEAVIRGGRSLRWQLNDGGLHDVPGDGGGELSPGEVRPAGWGVGRGFLHMKFQAAPGQELLGSRTSPCTRGEPPGQGHPAQAARPPRGRDRPHPHWAALGRGPAAGPAQASGSDRCSRGIFLSIPHPATFALSPSPPPRRLPLIRVAHPTRPHPGGRFLLKSSGPPHCETWPAPAPDY